MASPPAPGCAPSWWAQELTDLESQCQVATQWPFCPCLPATPRPVLGAPGKRDILTKVLQGEQPIFTILEPRLLVILVQ